MIEVETLVVPPLEANCYLARDPGTSQGVIIDPGGDAPAILAAAGRGGIRYETVINTHAHFDHAGSNGIKDKIGARLLLHRLEAPFLDKLAEQELMLLGFTVSDPPAEPDGFLEEGAAVAVGGEKLRVWHTPGHSPGGICLVGAGLVFSGDTLFRGGVGRSDFEGGSWPALACSLARLLTLPDETLVYPGHGPRTTIGAERDLLRALVLER